MRGIAWLVLAGACYAPHPQPGSPCQDDNCPTPLVCSTVTQTCELPGGIDAAVVHPVEAGCMPTGEICGDGIDQDCDGVDPNCATNDGPGNPIDVTAGGAFTANAMIARDDVRPFGCGGDGGRDLFYKVVLQAPQVYYLDTFGSSFDSVVRVFAKPCAMVGDGADARACVDDACGLAQSQVAVSLPAGESCIVVDQRTGDEANGTLALRVTKGGRDGEALPRGVSTHTGDTCDAKNVEDPVDQNCDGPGQDGKDVAYFFAACPGEVLHLDADTCNGTTDFDSVLYVRRVAGMQIGCDDDTCGNRARLENVTISNSLLYWLIVDGFDPGSCGPYQLDSDLR